MGKVVQLPRQTSLEAQIRHDDILEQMKRTGQLQNNHEKALKELMKSNGVDERKCKACDTGVRFV
jgi:hypothetical protein